MTTTMHIDREARARAKDLVHVLEDRQWGAASDVSLSSVRIFLEAVDDDFGRWMQGVETDEATRTEWRVLALRNSLPAFVSVCARSVPVTATALVSAWAEAAVTLGVRVSVPRLHRTTKRQPKPSLDAVIAFDAGIVEYAAKIKSTHEVTSVIRRLMAHLRLSYDDVGRMVGSSGETIRRWEQGQHAPTPEKQAVLTAADAALSRLLTMFKADALPAVIRRPAEIFDNERAFDWILRGRIVQVVDRYERELSYQR